MNTINIKILIKACTLLLCCSMLLSCSDESNGGDEGLKPNTYNVCGKVEKGPFVSGTTITMQPLDANMSTLGTMFTTTIYDHTGNFSFGAKQLASQFAELSANGYFFNEVKGELSSGTLNLRAIVDLSDASSINVNILTHIKYQRVLNLILQKGYSFSDANAQAQKELFAAFGLEDYAKNHDAANISIADGTDAAAALIAISSLILVDREEAELTEYLHRLCMEFSVNGKFSESTKNTISKDKGTLASNITEIEENVRERYEELGEAIEVKPLIGFIDWNDDGVAGNEILKDGEHVRLSSNSIEAPAEGHEYEVTISSPIPVFLERQLDNGNLNIEPDNTVTEDSFWNGLYEGHEGGNTGGDIILEKELNGDKLKIKVAGTNATTTCATNINLYDYIGNIVASIHVSQKGIENIEGTESTGSIIMPGGNGRAAINAIMVEMAEAFSGYNVIEQLYHSNPENPNIVSQYIYPSSSNIRDCWNNFYTAINRNLSIKSADASALGVWQERLNVLLAINYYNMVVAWGGVPFVWKYNQYDGGTAQLPRTKPEEIFAALKSRLYESIDVLEEKHLNTLNGNSMDYFFLSKDVARILLADILMYEGEYYEADKYLQQVIDAGHYTLDSSNYSEPDCINRINEARGGEEIIFALQCELGTTRGSITTQKAPIVPLMTYTDVMLSHAECLCHTENITEAEGILNDIASIKGITLETSGLEGIRDARKQLLLYGISNFAFMKRNGFAEQVYGISAYQCLWPIPSDEMNYNTSMTQNPGY